MIIRYPLFEGQIAPDQTADFRAAVLADILPKWQAFPGGLAVRVTFAEARDEGAPEYPLILAINYPDLAAVAIALASPTRSAGRAATEAVMAQFFIRAHPPTCHHSA